MIPSDEEELRRIKEKYGDLLDEDEEPKNASTPEEFLASLPPEAPISRSIFESGYYCGRVGIKYRSGFWTVWNGWGSNGCLFRFYDVFLKILFLPSGFFLLCTGNIYAGLFCLLLGIHVNALPLLEWHFRPSVEFDLDKRVIKRGRFFVSEVPFSQIEKILLREYTKTIHKNLIGTTIILCYSYKSIKAAFLYPDENYFYEEVVDVLKRILGRNLPEEYIAY